MTCVAEGGDPVVVTTPSTRWTTVKKWKEENNLEEVLVV